MSAFYVDNAMTWAQFRLKGGWKNVLVIGGAIFMLAVCVTVLMYESSSDQSSRRDSLTEITYLLLILHSVLLLAVGTAGVNSAIRADITSRRIESHRLMPLGAQQAVAGYVVATLARTVMLCTGTFVLGSAICDQGMVSQSHWLQANGVMLFGAFILYGIMTLLAFTSRWAFWILLGVSIVMFLSGGQVAMYTPGLYFLVAPYLPQSFGAGFGSMPLVGDIRTIVLSASAQWILALLCIKAAAKKYERDDRPGLPIWFSLTLLLLWAAVSAYAARHWYDYYSPRYYGDIAPQSQLVGTMSVLFVLGIMLASSLAWRQILRDRQLFIDAATGSAKPWLVPLIMLVAALVMTALTWCQPRTNSWPYVLHSFANPRRTVQVAAICIIGMLHAYFLMRILYPAMRLANLVVAGVIAVTWIGPIMADSIYDSIYNVPYQQTMSFLMQGSPPGWIAMATQKWESPLWGGLAFQAGILMVIWSIHLLVDRVRKRRSRLYFLPPSLLAADVVA
jgi:hypothetical protein